MLAAEESLCPSLGWRQGGGATSGAVAAPGSSQHKGGEAGTLEGTIGDMV